MACPRARVLLADDHRIVAEGLRSLLAEEFDLVGVVEDGRAMIEAARALTPHLVISDITMPHLNGIDAMIRLKQDNSQIKVVFLTMHLNPAYARRALEAGASGFVVKHSAPAELVMAVRAALKGETFITPALAAQVLQTTHRHRRGTDEQGGTLTPRQREILGFLVEGHSAKQIARTLSISARTVEFHKYQMMDVHNLHSSAELIHFAIRSGVVTI